jgi:hypothetical protein
MYCINDKQIEFILNDISARGVKMESLQQDILDHVCCIIEQNLEANGDFDSFYSKIIQSFYKKELKEIEEETQSLLTNKHFYTMKKVMINSGIISVVLLSLGIILKFEHLFGGNIALVLGVFFLSFVFLPLLFTLKIKEQKQTRDKVLTGIGTFAAILMTVAILFRRMHWPGSFIMALISVAILLLIFMPINLVNGIRNPDRKLNTIVTSVLIVAGCVLWFTFVV